MCLFTLLCIAKLHSSLATIAFLLTVTKQDSTAIVPGLENLLLEHDFRNQLLRRPTDQVLKRQFLGTSADNRKVFNLLAHHRSRFWPPLGIAEGIVYF